MQLSDLVRGTGIRGSPTAFTPALALRLGRALATQLRRRGDERAVFFGRDGDAAARALRDALVQGLLLSGAAVVDVAVVDADAFAFALRHSGVPTDSADAALFDVSASVFVAASGESVGVSLTLGGRALVGEPPAELARPGDAGTLAVGTATLTPRTLPAALRLRASEPRGAL